MGATALLAALLAAAGGCRSAVRPSGVLVVILDTVRADHLSGYGYDRPTTPNLDRLADEGERFAEAYSQAPWTLPSVATILTGQPPHVHGAGRTASGLFPLRPEVATLAERLEGSGYRRGAFMNVVWCHPDSGLSRGFETYDFATSDETNRGQRDARRTTDAAVDWLRGLAGEPFFLVVHYFDPHLTYDPPAPYDTLFEPDDTDRMASGFGSAADVFALRRGDLQLDARQRESLVARYDGELRFVDDQFGRLREALESQGVWDRTLVVVVGDHGEEFWDHGGFEHGHSHHRELLHVPLIVRRPGGPVGVVRPERVRLVDVAPTVLDGLGLPVPRELPGHVLGPEGAAPFAVAEGSLWAGDLVSVRSDLGTLILDRGTGARHFYAADDPLELRPLPAEGADPRRLLRILDALPPQRSAEPAPWLPTEEQMEQLRSLGYVQ